MPYAQDFAGIYVIKNTAVKKGYVGQSSCMKKRLADHFNLLRKNKHPNPHLQFSFNKYGEECFVAEVEVVCEDASELDLLEQAYLTGEASFDETPVYYNISLSSECPMRGREHTQETKEKISLAKKGRKDHVTETYRKNLSKAQHSRFWKDPQFVAKIKFLVDNDHMTYTARSRVLGIDASSARRLALKYSHLKGEL